VIRACLRNDPELQLTSGEQRRDFVYIDDVVQAYDVLANRWPELQAPASIDVGSGEAPPVREFVERVHRLTASSTRLAFGALTYRPEESMLYRADVDALQRLGWRPRHSLEEGLRRTIALETRP